METEIGDVARTSFITVFCHAIDNRSARPILPDPKPGEIADELGRMLASSDRELDRILISGQLPKSLVTMIALRAKRFDQYTADFLLRFPDGVVVNIGCGLDSRFLRTDNGRVTFYDLDLPEVIALRKKFYTEPERYNTISSSVLDFSWMDTVRQHRGPFLFTAEGVFMYLEDRDVRLLVQKLQEIFPGSELVTEVFSSFWLRQPWNMLAENKMQKRLHMGEGARFRSGIRDSRDMEKWHAGIVFLDDWSIFDADEPGLGLLRFFRHFRFMRMTQWVVHYLLK